MGVNEPDSYCPLPFTLMVELKTGAALQVLSLGPKSRNVIVPVGAKPLASVARSKTVPLPAVTGPEAVVEIVGAAFVTTTDSAGSLHALAVPMLLPSPL
jgi:hypothetical protein